MERNALAVVFGMRGRAVVLAMMFALGWGSALHAQFADKMKNPKPLDTRFKNPPTIDTSIHVRDEFIDRIAEDGFFCRLPAPAIVVADTPLFGEYEKNTDTVITPDWKQVSPEEKAIFATLAGPGATDAKVQELFDMEVHHWVLIVETVRWWEACKELTLKLTPYKAELEGVRVALAYWREHDPDLVARLQTIAETMDKEPSPVPPEQDLPTYFNQHYQKKASGKEYLWMQSQIVKIAMAETPEPALIQTMKQLE